MGDEREARRENEEPETEGHLRRANEPGADAENDDPQAREGRRENEEPETEGHYRSGRTSRARTQRTPTRRRAMPAGRTRSRATMPRSRVT